MSDARSTASRRLAIRGFGEAATAFVSGWNRDTLQSISTYDEKIQSADEKDVLKQRFAAHDVTGCDDAAAAFTDAEVVVSLVYADRALDAAQDTARYLKPGAIFIDGNSCSPQTKMRAETALTDAGALYVDMAIMAPVHPGREKTPVLLSGAAAEEARQILTALGMTPRVMGERVGQASAIKLTRSIMVKGMEALYAACFTAARLGGVEDEVLASLEASDPDVAWAKRRAYAFDRMTVHGKRRAAEMMEAANMVRELGLPDDLQRATAHWQQLMGDLPVQTDSVADVLSAMGKG